MVPVLGLPGQADPIVGAEASGLAADALVGLLRAARLFGEWHSMSEPQIGAGGRGEHVPDPLDRVIEGP
ncbi:hypothetical protein [Nostocoides sp.]|uniref:hypothetical protein n=1 Tax=Nostocoides sp. TaxID=1917966 RepID=UPI003BB15CCB